MPDLVLTLYNTSPFAPTSVGATVTDNKTGVVYTFASPVEHGAYWNGDPFVVSRGSDVVITSIFPASATGTYTILGDGTTGTRTVNGAMLQPTDTNPNGFDDARPYPTFNPSVNVDPGVTGENLVIDFATYPGGASVVKALSLIDLTQQIQLNHIIDNYSVLTVVPEVPPANAFRPPITGTDKTAYYTIDDLDFSKLKSVTPVVDQPPITDFDYLKNGTFVSWHSASEEGRPLHPDPFRNNYNDYYLDNEIMPALMALHSDYTNEEKRDLYAAIVQQGIDYAGFNRENGKWLSTSTHVELFPPIVATAAVALNSQSLRDQAGLSKGIYENYFHVTQDFIGVESFSFTSTHKPSFSMYEQGEIGKPDWRITFGNFDPSLASSYRGVNTDTVPTIALLMDMLGDGDGRSVLSNPAYFDYAERVRLIMEVEPSMGTGSVHAQTPLEAAFLAAYNATYSNHSGMTFKPERPYDIAVTATGATSLSVSIDGDVFPGSSPVTRVDLRYKVRGGEWTVAQDFGISGNITGLTADKIYFVQARFVNAIGEGPWSFNEFNDTNSVIGEYLLDQGAITQAELDASYGGALSAWRSSPAYEALLREIWEGAAGREALTVALVTGTAKTDAV